MLNIKKNKVPIFFLILSVFIGYISSWAPYYFNLLGRNQIQVLGSLTDFEVSCSNQSVQSCTNRYVIPKALFPMEAKNISIGFGHITNNVSYGCFDGGRFQTIVDYDVNYQPAQIHAYRVMSLDSFQSCKENIGVQTLAANYDLRKGYYGGLLVYGDSTRIDVLKRFIEFFLIMLVQMLGLVGLGFFLIVNNVSKSLGLTQGQKSFFNLIPFWFLTFFLSSGLITNLIPIENDFRVFIRAGSYFSNLSFFLLGAHYLKRLNMNNVMARTWILMEAPLFWEKKLGFFAPFTSTGSVIFLAFAVTPVASLGFGWWHVFIATAYFFMTRRNVEFLCLAIAYSLSVLKIFNVLYAPQSNTVFFYIAFYFVYETYLFIRLELNAFLYAMISKSTMDSSLAKQIVHDIRSPIGALKMIFSQVKWDNDSQDAREVALNALSRVSDISKVALDASQTRVEISDINFDHFLSDVIKEKKLQFPDLLFSLNASSDSLKVRFSEQELYRVVGNLLENACTAKRVSKVNINVSSEDTQVLIVIENDGDVIPKDVLHEILKNGGSYNKQNGSGLGLSYCQSTIRKYAGQFFMTSDGRITRVIVKILKA